MSWTNMMTWRECIQSRRRWEGRGIIIFIIEMWSDLQGSNGSNSLSNVLTLQVSTLTTFENFKKWTTRLHPKKKFHPLSGLTFRMNMEPTFHPLKRSSFLLPSDRGNLLSRVKRRLKTTLTWMLKTMCWGMMNE